MKERGVDVILCPAYIGAAAQLGTGKYWLYTAIWNILDQPAAIFPTGLKVDSELDPVEVSYTPRSRQDEDEYKKCKFPLCVQDLLRFRIVFNEAIANGGM
jgi:hypothetical protein